MARQPQVTRTIITTKVNVLVVNTAERTTKEAEFILPRTYKDEKALLKALDKCATLGENERIVSVISTDEVETLYGMTESDFIKYATVLPPRTKADDTDETEENN